MLEPKPGVGNPPPPPNPNPGVGGANAPGNKPVDPNDMRPDINADDADRQK